ncbi:MAG: MOSC domain-containing protein, partial [Nitrososphaerales archaeon]
LRHERFRANFYVDWNNREAFFEDDLIGRSLRIGEHVVIRVEKKDSRCVVPTLDIKTAESSPEILRTIQKNHKGCIGVYAITEGEGFVQLGDPIYLQCGEE